MYDPQIVHLLAFEALCVSEEGGIVLEAADHRVVFLALSKSEVRGTGRFQEEGSHKQKSIKYREKTHFIALNCKNTRKYTLLTSNDGQGHNFQRGHGLTS